VLVIAHEKVDLKSVKALEPGHYIGPDLLVGGPDMG
jgi:hypothetical protein